ncbi:MAG: TonB-dependent receptor [Bacteroidota bacterium]
MRYILALLITLTSLFASARTGNAKPAPPAEDGKFSLSGYVKDSKSGEALIGATVYIKALKIGTTTNVYGFYSITLPAGVYDITCSYVGYTTWAQSVDLTKNHKQNIELAEVENQTEEVTVTADRPIDNVKKVEMSVNKLEMRTIEKIPALLGEVDVVRTIQLLPGVSTVGEGSSGFNVRGGSTDQNLVLLDQAPVFNSSHLFGFFSVFNPDAVANLKLMKGGIPAQYGGRLASVLDVRLKEGNNKKVSVKGGLGIIFSRLTIEAPIKKDKGSFIIAGRRSYGDLFLKLSSDKDLRKTSLYFYDLTAKANYSIGEKDKVFLSGYLGRDVFGSNSFGFQWGNTTTTARWNHVFNDKLFLNTIGYWSKYDYKLGAGTGDGSFDWTASIINTSFSPEFTWYPNPQNQITFGGQSIYYTIKPGAFLATASDGSPGGNSVPNQYGAESALFIANEQTISPRFTAQYGLRYSMFNRLGKGTAFNYNTTGVLNTEHPVIDSVDYSGNAVMKTYTVPEPRLALKYDVNDKSSIKASYNRMSQYIHLISSTTAATPLDVYTMSSNNTKAEIADQVALGYFRNFGLNSDWEASVEVYYKDMQNQIDYVDHADLLVNPHLEGSLLYGKGRSYGAEFYLKKATGRLTGWVSYTLSKTERQVNGINNNAWYNAKMDRPHNLNVVGSYDITKKYCLGANVVYTTGTAVGLSTDRLIFDGQTKGVPTSPANKRNSFRNPDTFRIDLSLTIQGHKRKPEHWYTDYESTWVFSVYNVLGRQNAFGVYTEQVATNPQLYRAMQFSVFGSQIPGVTWNFTF